MEIVLSMLFITFSNTDVQFAKTKLTRRIYITKKALPTICWVELINSKKFAKAVLIKNINIFVVHISSLRLKITIDLATEAQTALLLAEKVTVLAKYSDFADAFLEESANVLPEQTRVNEHAIKLEKGQAITL